MLGNVGVGECLFHEGGKDDKGKYVTYYKVTKAMEDCGSYWTSWYGDLYKAYAIDNPELRAGEEIGYVYSNTRTEYPDSGLKGELWYEWRGIE